MTKRFGDRLGPEPECYQDYSITEGDLGDKANRRSAKQATTAWRSAVAHVAAAVASGDVDLAVKWAAVVSALK